MEPLEDSDCSEDFEIKDAGMDVQMSTAESKFNTYIFMETKRENEAQLKDKIHVSEYVHHFNYGLSPHTWNLMVNKQIYMVFERISIEKQLEEKQKRQMEALQKISRLERETQEMIVKRKKLEQLDMH